MQKTQNQTIGMKQIENENALIGNFFSELFNPKRIELIMESSWEYIQYTFSLHLINLDSWKLEHLETIVKEMKKRFPKKIFTKSIYFVLLDLPFHEHIGYELTLFTLPKQVRDFVESRLNKQYPNIIQSINLKF
jgi:hypothetical protein